MSIIIAFELGYIFFMIGQMIIIRQILIKKHVEGISYYSQSLIAVSQLIKIFYFPFTILNEYIVCWLEYFITAINCIYILYLFKVYKRMSANPERNYFDWRILIVASLVLALVSNYEKKEEFEYSQLVIRFSIILEALAMLPQLRVMREDKFVSQFLGYYLTVLSLSRISRLFFWYLQLSLMHNQSTYYTIILADVFYLVLTCDFIYSFFKNRKNNLIPYY